MRWAATAGRRRVVAMARRDVLSGATSAMACRNSSSSGCERIEVFLRVESRHATGGGARHGLPVHVVLDVARGKNPRHAGGGCEAFAAPARDDVAIFHLELP